MNKLRLAYIEALIVTQDKVNSKDVQAMFGIKSAAAGRDFMKYNKLYPGNLKYCLVARCYKATVGFKSQALTTMADDFLENLKALEDYF